MLTRMKFSWSWTYLFLLFAFPSPLWSADTSMSDRVREYTADDASLDTFYAIPCSEWTIEHREKLCEDWLTRLHDVSFGSLDQTGRVDYVLLRNQIQSQQAQAFHDRAHLVELEPLVPFRSNLLAVVQKDWPSNKVDAPAAATAVSDLSKQVAVLKDRVLAGLHSKSDGASADKTVANNVSVATNPPPLMVSPALALRASEAVEQLRTALKTWFAKYDGFSPDVTWWLKQPCEEADKALEEYGKTLREEVAGQKGKEDDPLVGEPCGTNVVAENLRFEFIPYNAQEIIAYAERELSRGEEEMKRASREMGFGDDWHAALAQVQADHVQPGEQAVLVAQTCREAIAFTHAHDLVTIPPLCESTWQVTMLSPQELKTIPYAAYNNQRMMVAYACQSMNQENKQMVMNGNSRAFVRLTTAHELIPGHHLQLFVAARKNNHRRLFSTTFAIEGWAFYVEMRFWELGWARTPQERIGMLFWRMNRAARTLVSLKFQLGQMKPDDMVTFMMKHVGHQKFGAASEVRRMIRSEPLYQTAYLLGAHQYLALHDEQVVHGRMTERQFHDAVLEGNSIPVEMLRAGMGQMSLTPDSVSTWKFAGEHPGSEP